MLGMLNAPNAYAMGLGHDCDVGDDECSLERTQWDLDISQRHDVRHNECSPDTQEDLCISQIALPGRGIVTGGSVNHAQVEPLLTQH